MIYLLIFLFHLFHYGKAQEVLGPVPLVVRSPDLNCWSYDGHYLSNGYMIAADCSYSNLGSAQNAWYFLAWRNTKIDHTLDT